MMVWRGSNERDYGAAKKSFQTLDKQYPYSEYTKRGLMLTTYANYSEGSYTDAIASGRRFIQLYPSDKDTPYAVYLVGMSYFNQIPDSGRDQDRAEKALGAFNELVTRYPDSEYVPDAKKRMIVARDQLAAKEMNVGRYYLNQRNYTGAINRFREVLVIYQTTRHTEKRWPASPRPILQWAWSMRRRPPARCSATTSRKARVQGYLRAAEERGLEPRENTGSWISKAFRAVGLGG